jgi:flagellum-specific ATP synthase
LISIGAYRRGANPTVDAAIALWAEINGYLRQQVGEPSSIEEAQKELRKLAARCAAAIKAPSSGQAGGAAAAPAHMSSR